jgi:putative flippase GtrA
MKILKYFFVGGAAACIDIGLFYIFAVLLDWNYQIVGTCTFILATLFNYFISIRTVFTSGIRFSKRNELILIFVISGFGLFLNQFILYLCTSWKICGLLFAKILATAGVFFWNYFMRSRYVFVQTKNVV